MHNRGSFLLAAAVAALLVAGALAYGLSHGAEVAGAPPQASTARPVAPASAAVPVPPAPPRAARLAAAPPSQAASDADESLARKVDRLSRSGNPVDAFAAYRLVTACIWARDHEGWMTRHILPGDRALLPTPRQACGDIASDQVQSRLRWLERAALAGVHHAATEMLKEGPDGLGGVDIDAPANALWKQQVETARAAGVRTCDADSLEDRVDRYAGGQGVEPDRARALAYWVAYVECRRRAAGTPAAVLGNGDSLTRGMGRSLSADQVARAVSEGEQIAHDARPLPGDD